MRLVYFAKVRETIGRAQDDVAIPEQVRSVADLVAWLASNGAEYKMAFADLNRLRFALDQEMVSPDAPLNEAQELAIFPPVTGG